MKKLFITFCTLVLTIAIIFTFGNKVLAKQSGVGKVDNLLCNPGEDCSTQLRFNWLSSEVACYFYFTNENDPSFEKASKTKVMGKLEPDAFPNISSDEIKEFTVYSYEYDVSNLVPGTKYLYKVSTFKEDYTTPVHNATTAKLDGSFNFIWVGDNHLHCADWAVSKRTDPTWAMMRSAVSQMKSKNGLDTNLIVSSGDTVSYGSYYDDHLEWNESYAYTNFVYAEAPGNHDYYSRVTGSSVMTDYPYSWEACQNMPENGFSEFLELGMKSNSYFFYNSCLFIGIDSIASKKYHDQQEAWIKRIVNEHEGEYQWLIVFEHYPFFDGETASTTHYSGSGYASWWKAFDEIGVDIALSGDSHVYLRSKPLRNNKIDPSGTIYMTCPQIGDRFRFITEEQNSSWMDVRIGTGVNGDTSNYGLQNQSGLGYFMISPEELTYCLIDPSLKVKDTYTISARRELPQSLIAKQAVQNQALVESFELLGHNGTESESLVFDYNRVGYIKNVEVKQGTKTIVNSSSLTSSIIDLGNLEDNKVHELDINIEFSNGEKQSFKVYGSTYDYYGTISNFKVNVRDDKTVLTWDAEVSSLIGKYEVYEGDTCLGTSTTKELALDTKKDINTVYTLKAYTTNDEIIYVANASYKLIGDINYDGVVDIKDCDRISDIVFAPTPALSDLEKQFGDLNNDGRVNFADAAMIMLYKSGKINKTFIEEYTVTFKDETGKDLSIVTVQYGDDATAPNIPTKDGYTFIGWSKPVTNVTTNLVVYALYQKN